jgi:hypothetical protein
MGNKSISASHIKSNSTCLARSAVRRGLHSDIGLSAQEIETFVLVNGVKAVAEGLTVIAGDTAGRVLGARFSEATFPRPKLQYN